MGAPAWGPQDWDKPEASKRIQWCEANVPWNGNGDQVQACEEF